MTAQAVPGGGGIPFGAYVLQPISDPTFAASILMDAAKEAIIMIGQIVTSDGGSHTIDTTGSSSLAWRAGAVTFANAGTTVKVGLATVDTTTGPPGRAVNVADVITFDVSKSLTGGGGGITANAAQNHVPDTGTKTIANGDFVAFCVQMTAVAGADLVNATTGNQSGERRPSVTSFTGGAYASVTSPPDAFITFSDGATGYFLGGQVFSTVASTNFNNGSSPKEIGQLYQFPFPVTVSGIMVMGGSTATGNFDLVLYTDPLGTPVAQATASVTGATLMSASSGRILAGFATPYTVPANTPFAVIMKPTTANNVNITSKVLGNAAQRISDPFGIVGYGVSRSSGAFANVNSSLTNYYIGPLVTSFADDAFNGLPASRMRLGM